MSDVLQQGETDRQHLIVGLGNPGGRYRGTRHNLGFRVVTELADRLTLKLDRVECNALIAETSGLILAAPQTYMNRSGFAVRCLVERRHVPPGDTLIVYDDVHLVLGRMRLRSGGGPGGHRGIESVIQSLQTEAIPRLRLGVAAADSGPIDDDMVEFVLSPFEPEEHQAVDELILRAADACESWVGDGAEATMNRFNC